MQNQSGTDMPAPQAPGQNSGIRILIIDDEFDAADSVREILEMEGHIVGVAEDQASALEAARLMTPDAAFVDLRLKNEWGLDVIHALRNEFPDILCIVQTGNSDSSVVITALRQGVYDYLVKPFEPDQLLTVVARAAEKITLQNERREIMARLSSAHEQAELASRSKTEFLTRMGGELASHFETLATLANSVASQQFGPLGDPSYQVCANGIATGCTRMLNNMKHIGELGYLEAGKVKANPAPFDLIEIIQELAGEFQAALAKKQLGASAAIADDLPEIHSDRRHMMEIMRHLLSNAIKFSPAASTIEIAARMDEKGALILTVADQGPGIDPQKVALAMAPFGRIDDGDGAHDEDPFSAGLGLPLASGLASLLGGALTLAANQPRGTVATVYFPGKAVFEFAKRRSEYI